MADYNTVLALKNALETAIKNGGVTGKVRTDDIYAAMAEIIDNAGLLKQKVTFAKEQIYTVYSNPVTLLDSPGEKKANIPVLLVAEKPGGNAFSGGNDISVRYYGGSESLLTLKATGFLDQTSQVVIFNGTFTGQAALVNEKIYLYSAKDPSAAGGSDINIWIYYREIDLG